MPLESATWVNQLDQTRPTATDVKSEGDDVMRLIKSTLKNSLPNIGGAMNATHTELNRLVGATEDVQPRLSATLSAPNGETLNRLPAAASRQGGFLTFNASTGQPEVSFSLATASANSLGIFSVSNVTTFFTAGTERMRIDASGNVAVGNNSSPASALHVQRTGNAELRISTFTSGNPVLSLRAEGSDGGSISYERATSAMLLETSGSVRMRIDTSGNVGIGTGGATASSRLDVRNGTAANTRTSYFTQGASDPNFRLGFANGSGSGTGTQQAVLTFDYVGTGQIAAIGFLRGASVNSDGITFEVNASERMRIDGSGNVISNLNATAPALTVNQQMVFALTSNTNLRISVRGTDGVTRVANLTLA